MRSGAQIISYELSVGMSIITMVVLMGCLLYTSRCVEETGGAVSLFYKENDLQSFLISSAITTGVCILMLAIGKGAEKSLNRRDG